MIDWLLPTSVRTGETFADRTDVDLFPEEQAMIERAVEKRRREFATVRSCARDALSELGVPPAPIIPGPQGAPKWPDGIVGSMTHCDGYRAAAVAHAVDFDSIGIDAEPNFSLPTGVLAAISTPQDLACLPHLAETGVAADRLLFSAKESIYKSWFPLAQRWLGFDEVAVTLQTDGTFAARLLVDGVLTDGRRIYGFDGRWLVHRDLILTTVTVPTGTVKYWA